MYIYQLRDKKTGILLRDGQIYKTLGHARTALTYIYNWYEKYTKKINPKAEAPQLEIIEYDCLRTLTYNY